MKLNFFDKKTVYSKNIWQNKMCSDKIWNLNHLKNEIHQVSHNAGHKSSDMFVRSIKRVSLHMNDCRSVLLNVRCYAVLNVHLRYILTCGVFAFLSQIPQHSAHAPFVPIILYFRVIAAERKRNPDCQHYKNSTEKWAQRNNVDMINKHKD